MPISISGSGTITGASSFSSNTIFGGSVGVSGAVNTSSNLLVSGQANVAQGLSTASGGITQGSMPAGSVLQVQSTTKTSVFSTTSTSYTDVTGLTVSITPTSSSSKILILVSVSLGAGNILTSARLVRNSTALAVGDAAGSRIQTSVAYVGGGGVSGIDGMAPVQNITYLDSPATTSSTTYKIQMQVSSGTGYLNQASDDQNAAYRPRMSSTITVMEIAV